MLIGLITPNMFQTFYIIFFLIRVQELTHAPDVKQDKLFDTCLIYKYIYQVTAILLKQLRQNVYKRMLDPILVFKSSIDFRDKIFGVI